MGVGVSGQETQGQQEELGRLSWHHFGAALGCLTLRRGPDWVQLESSQPGGTDPVPGSGVEVATDLAVPVQAVGAVGRGCVAAGGFGHSRGAGAVMPALARTGKAPASELEAERKHSRAPSPQGHSLPPNPAQPVTPGSQPLNLRPGVMAQRGGRSPGSGTIRVWPLSPVELCQESALSTARCAPQNKNLNPCPVDVGPVWLRCLLRADPGSGTGTVVPEHGQMH